MLIDERLLTDDVLLGDDADEGLLVLEGELTDDWLLGYEDSLDGVDREEGLLGLLIEDNVLIDETLLGEDAEETLLKLDKVLAED